MTGMDEMPDGRPLTLGGWPGEGVRAGDEGKLLYTQHNRRCGGGGGWGGLRRRGWRNTSTSFKKTQLWLFLLFFLFGEVILLFTLWL